MADLVFAHPLMSLAAFVVVVWPVAFLFSCATAGQMHVWAVDRMNSPQNAAYKAKLQRTWMYRVSKWIGGRSNG